MTEQEYFDSMKTTQIEHVNNFDNRGYCVNKASEFISVDISVKTLAIRFADGCNGYLCEFSKPDYFMTMSYCIENDETVATDWQQIIEDTQ